MLDTGRLLKSIKAVAKSEEYSKSADSDLELALRTFIKDYLQEEAWIGSAWLRDVILKIANPNQIRR